MKQFRRSTEKNKNFMIIVIAKKWAFSWENKTVMRNRSVKVDDLKVPKQTVHKYLKSENVISSWFTP